jgi:transcriptional regulator with XRE-family HTH domain
MPPKLTLAGRIDQARKDERAAELAARGLTLREIADELGVATPEAARRMVNRYLARFPAETAEEVRRLGSARLDRAIHRLMEVLDYTTYIYTPQGELVRGPDGQPMVDYDKTIRAALAISAIEERRARLYGADAPKRSVELRMDYDTIKSALEEQGKALGIPDPLAAARAIAALPAAPHEEKGSGGTPPGR